MKCKKGWLLIVLIVGIIVSIAYTVRSEKKQEFVIVQSIKNSFGNYEEVLLSVIVNLSEYDEEEMANKVYMLYSEMNGNVDELEIRLYNSQKHFEIEKVHYYAEYNKSNP